MNYNEKEERRRIVGLKMDKSLIRKEGDSWRPNFVAWDQKPLDPTEKIRGMAQSIAQNWEKFASTFPNKLDNIVVRKLLADRDIVEEERDKDLILNENGRGATNILRAYLQSQEGSQRNLIEKNLLKELNKIMIPEAEFERINIHEAGEGFGIDLTERSKEHYPLSSCGSGLKTVILVLLNILVMPDIDKRKGISKEQAFIFEELENNLHPALQRRLFEYIGDYAKKNETCVFISTHSPVAINIFAEDPDASIYHITKNEKKTSIKKVNNHSGRSTILDDLDVRASDILQANGIVWVEGPTDRYYVRRWIELTAPDLKEGRDYQILPYGGKLLSHYGATDDEVGDWINILLTNRNAAIIIDSDKGTERDEINATKKRIAKEFEDDGRLCWITQGREIENYLSLDSIKEAYPEASEQVDQYTLFIDYLGGQGITKDKVEFAKNVRGLITKDSLGIMDLKEKAESLCKEIRKWNRKPSS
jgi:hypothetical protein